jgi:MFS transporter, ACS family, allantoate permease
VEYVADRTRQRRSDYRCGELFGTFRQDFSLSAIAIQLVSLFAASLLVELGNVGPLYLRAGQLAAYFIMIGSCAIGYYLVLAMASSNVLGATKKTTTNVILFIYMAASYLVG